MKSNMVWLLFIFSFFFVIGCMPTAVSSPGFYGFVGDIKSSTDEVLGYKDSNIVSIGAGYVRIGKYSHWNAWYLIDKSTQTCWFQVSASTQSLDCCKLRKIDAAKQFLNFLSPEDCGDGGNSDVIVPAKETPQVGAVTPSSATE